MNIAEANKNHGRPSSCAMRDSEAYELRSKARRYRERADRELRDPVVTEAFYRIAATLERRAVMREAAMLEDARRDC